MLGAVVGATVTALVGWFLTPAPPPAVDVDAQEVPVAGASTPAVVSATRVPACDDDAVNARVEALETENRHLLDQLAELGGIDAPFPDSVPAFFREAELDEQLRQAEAQLDGVERVDLDCSEFPCIAVYRWGPELPRSTSVLLPVDQAVLDAAGAAGHRVGMSSRSASSEDGMVVTLSFFPADQRETAAVQERLRVRSADHLMNQGASSVP